MNFLAIVRCPEFRTPHQKRIDTKLQKKNYFMLKNLDLLASLLEKKKKKNVSHSLREHAAELKGYNSTRDKNHT